MKHLFFIMSFVLTLSNLQTGFTEEIIVGFEPLPPLIIDQDTGYTIDMLKEIEKNSDLTFNIKIMPYNRVKHSLSNGSIDLGGHTPYAMETPDFYEYASDVEWHVTTLIDVYSKKKDNVTGDGFKEFKKIGTPRGNEGFMSEFLEIPIDNFFVNDLEILAKMLNGNRIDVILFERSATMSTIHKFNFSGIHYRMIDNSIKAGFAVNKNNKGQQIKTMLEKAISQIDQDTIFKDFFRFTKLPNEGIVAK